MDGPFTNASLGERSPLPAFPGSGTRRSSPMSSYALLPGPRFDSRLVMHDDFVRTSIHDDGIIIGVGIAADSGGLHGHATLVG